MRLSPSLPELAVTATLVSAASAALRIPIVKNRDVEREQLEQPRLGKRDTVHAQLTNARKQGLYFANVSVGTPPQQLSLQIDTGSSDVWVPDSKSNYCRERRRACALGSFNPDESQTYRVVGKDDFNISYVDNTGAQGEYFTDVLAIGGREIQDFQMGLASDTTIGTGIMGLGFSNSEANVFTGNGTEYANLPLALVNAGLISTPAYSLWLDDVHASTGSILFGGVDTTKYEGQLQSIDLYPNKARQNITSFTVAFTSLSATSSTGTDILTPPDFAQPAILDSGTTLTLLPDQLAELVFAELGATNDERLGAVLVPCTLANNTGMLNYGFGGPGGPQIRIPMSELVLPLTLSSGGSAVFDDGTPACQLGIQAAGNLPTLFGDTFLRSAYVVYDLDNQRIGMAQTDFDASGENIVEFASRGAVIPDAVTATASVDIGSETETGSPRGTGESGGETPVGSGDPGSQGSPTSTGLSAASGFAESKGGRVEPFRWNTAVGVVCWSVLMVIGGGTVRWA